MGVQVGVSLTDEVFETVESWRKSLPVPPTKSAALAHVVAVGIAVLLKNPMARPETVGGDGVTVPAESSAG